MDATARSDIKPQTRMPVVFIAHGYPPLFDDTRWVVPVLTALGADAEQGSPIQFPIHGFFAGSLTRRSVQWG